MCSRDATAKPYSVPIDTVNAKQLVLCYGIGFTIAAKDFSLGRDVSDEQIPTWVCQEQAMKSKRKKYRRWDIESL